MDGWVDGWLGGCMDGWMIEWSKAWEKEILFIIINIFNTELQRSQNQMVEDNVRLKHLHIHTAETFRISKVAVENKLKEIYVRYLV